MKRNIALFITLVAALSFLWVGVTHALNLHTGESPAVAANDTVDGTWYAAGSTVTVAGTVKGDVICGGQQLSITGTVEGDVLCAAQTITISGHVLGDVRTASQSLDVSGKVDGSMSSVGQTINLASGAVIGRDLSLAGQTVHNNANVMRDANVVASSFDANGMTGRDLDVHSASAVSLGGNAVVTGTFNYTSTPDAQVASGAKVGTTNHYLPPQNSDSQTQKWGTAVYLSGIVFGFAGFLVIGLVLLLLAPRLLGATAGHIERAPLLTLGVGFMALVVPPVVAIMLMIAIIGIPLGIAILFGWIASLIVASVFAAQALGNVIVAKMQWQDNWRNFVGLVLGLFVLFLIALVPFIGGLVSFLALLWGLGGLWYTFFTNLRGGTTAVTAPVHTKGAKKVS